MNDRQCDGCGQASGHIKVYQTRGSEYSELWLCAKCAEVLGVEEETPAFGPTVGEMVGSLIGDVGTRSCPSCGTRFRSIRQSGKVGCAECYRVFRSKIHHLLHQQGLTEAHHGRYPARLDSFKRLLVDRESLRDKLNQAVDDEDYETAAAIRDRMKALEEAGDENV
jgi:protein arginine kinase activator